MNYAPEPVPRLDRVEPVVEKINSHLSRRLLGIRLRGKLGHGVVSSPTLQRRTIEVDHPGDYANPNSYQPCDGTTVRTIWRSGCSPVSVFGRVLDNRGRAAAAAQNRDVFSSSLRRGLLLILCGCATRSPKGGAWWACLELRTRNQTVMSGRISISFVDLSAFCSSSIAFVTFRSRRFWCETGAAAQTYPHGEYCQLG